jgi:hypothetical protein
VVQAYILIQTEVGMAGQVAKEAAAIKGTCPGTGYSPGNGSSGPHETGTSLGAPATSSSESAIWTPGPQCARPVAETVIASTRTPMPVSAGTASR